MSILFFDNDDPPIAQAIEGICSLKTLTTIQKCCISQVKYFKDAKVACHMMGYSKAVRILTNGSDSLKSGPMLMSQLQCDGTEDQLSHCDYDDAYGCTLDKAVALQCSSKLFINILLVTYPILIID